MPRRRLKGGVKFDTEEEFNKAIQEHIDELNTKARIYLAKPPAEININEFVDMLQIGQEKIDKLKMENTEFEINKQLQDLIIDILEGLISLGEQRKKGIMDIIELNRITKEYEETTDPKVKKEKLKKDVNLTSRQLLESFEFNKWEENDRGDYIFWESDSTKAGMDKVSLITYLIKNGDVIPHRITIICRDDGLVYYNSTGEKFENLPKDLQEYILINYCKPLIEENLIAHQTRAPICERHSLLRACNPHLSNEE